MLVLPSLLLVSGTALDIDGITSDRTPMTVYCLILSVIHLDQVCVRFLMFCCRCTVGAVGVVLSSFPPHDRRPTTSQLADIGWQTVRDQFLSNAAWRAKFLKDGDAPDFDVESLREHVIMGICLLYTSPSPRDRG